MIPKKKFVFCVAFYICDSAVWAAGLFHARQDCFVVESFTGMRGGRMDHRLARPLRCHNISYVPHPKIEKDCIGSAVVTAGTRVVDDISSLDGYESIGYPGRP